MTRFFNKLSRLAVVAVLAGVAMPQAASADGHNGGRSFKSFRSSGNGQFSGGAMKLQSQPQTKVFKPSINSGSFNKSAQPLKLSGGGRIGNPGTASGIKIAPLGKRWQDNVSVVPGKFTPQPGKFPTTPIVNKGGVLNPFPGGKPPKIDTPIKPLPTGPIVTPFPGGGKPPKVDTPIKPLPTGPIVNPFPGGGKPPKVDTPIKPLPTGPIVNPFPGGSKPPKPLPPIKPLPTGPIVNPFPGGGKPPVTPPPVDPGPGPGNGGGNPSPPQDNHHHKCPWPIFWPVYGNNNYWHNGYYRGPAYCPPTVITNQVPVVVNEVTPVVATTPVAGAATGSSIDLVLEDVQYVEPATMLVGPAYRVKFRNQGMHAAGEFRVALVASLGGQVTASSPMALVDVTGLASGESGEVTVRLPRTAMQLSNDQGQPVAFTHLLVAADFDNAIGETEKTNNIAIIERTQLEVAAR